MLTPYTANNRANEIDLLRFLAMLAVVLFHYAFRGYAANDLTVMPYLWLAPFAKYGYLGVNLFFLISGFVIMMSASGGKLKPFVISRVARLYPAFWVCCTITFLAIVAMGAPRYSATFAEYAINMTMLNGFVNVPSIDGVYWSLFVEIRFYVFVGLVLLFRQIRRAEMLLLAWLLILIAIDLFRLSNLRELAIAEYGPYFIGGGLFYFVWSGGMNRSRAAALIATWTYAVRQALSGAFEFERHYQVSLNAWVIAAIISVFFCVFFLVALKRTGRIGKTNWLAIGALTYPAYLLHQNVGYMLFNRAYPQVNPHVLLWGTVLMMLVAAFLVNAFVEKRYAASFKTALNRLADRTSRLVGNLFTSARTSG